MEHTERFRIFDLEFQKKLDANPELFEAYKAGYLDGTEMTRTIYQADPKKLKQWLDENGK